MATTTDTLTETPTTTEAAAAKSARTFRQSGLLSESTLRKLRTRHQEFGHAVAVKLGALLRLDCQVDIAALQTVSFEAFLGRLLTPTHLVLFKLESLRGICILETPPQFALPIVNRLLGGSSKSVEKDNSRVLNEIETALLDQIADILLGEWCHVWKGTCCTCRAGGGTTCNRSAIHCWGMRSTAAFSTRPHGIR